MNEEINKDFSAELESAISLVMEAKKYQRNRAMEFIASKLKKSDGEPYANNRQVYKWLNGEDVPHNIAFVLDQVRAIISTMPLQPAAPKQKSDGTNYDMMTKYLFEFISEHREMKEEIEQLKTKIKALEARDKYFGLYYKTEK